MVSGLYMLLWAVATATALLSRLAMAVGPVVRCDPCDTRALEQCKPMVLECPELVREPGCGCCLTCALQEGQPCGVYTERCGSGLNCRPRGDEPKPLQALLDGKGRCKIVNVDPASGSNSSSSSGVRDFLLRGTHRPGNSSESDEEQNSSSSENQSVPSTNRMLDSKPHVHQMKIDVIKKEYAKNTQRYKYDSQSTDTQNFSSESKQETEYGPCRREMEDTLNNLKILNVLSPRGLHIPNCDKKGFYKKKQVGIYMLGELKKESHHQVISEPPCRPSRGRKRGYCWCVDKYGQPLPGYDGKGKGEVHCYSLESK